MIKKILTYNNEEDNKILSQVCSTVENLDEVKTLIQDMKDTLNAAVNDARGMSANQIGETKRVCICKWDNKEIIMINPIITRARGQQEYTEGCLSVPGVYKKVTRFQKVWCTYLDENWNVQEIAEGGRMSDIIQHELDHLNGVCAIHEELN